MGARFLSNDDKMQIEKQKTFNVRIRRGHGSEQAQLQSSLQEQQRALSGAGFYLLSIFDYPTIWLKKTVEILYLFNLILNAGKLVGAKLL